MPELAGAPLGLSILYLLRQTESQAPEMARDLIARARSEIGDEALLVNLIELIETVIIYKLPSLNREEIQAMLKVHDIRESRVYQEALKEGKEEGLKEGEEKGLKEGEEKGLKVAIGKMAARKMSVEEIASILEVNIDMVQQVLAETDRQN